MNKLDEMIQGFLSALEGKVPFGDVRVVFDVGSRDCAQALELAGAFPNATIYAFECNPQTLPLCRAVASSHARIILIEKAVHVTNGTVAFYAIDPEKTRTSWKDGNPGASSLYLANGTYEHETYVQREIKVPSIRLDTFCRSVGIDAVDVMWLDVQGGEAGVFQSMGTELLRTVRAIHTEVTFREMYHGQCMWPDVYRLLTETGLKLHNPEIAAEYERVQRGTSTCWQSDAIFIQPQSKSEETIIDVIVPAHAKDREVLLECLLSVKKYVSNVRRVICVSAERFQEIDEAKCEWFPETSDSFSFSRNNVEVELLSGMQDVASVQSRVGWYFQQLIKLEAPIRIPGLSRNVLMVDADVIWQRDISCFDPNTGRALYGISDEKHIPYFQHMARLDPLFERANEDSGICHHILFQKPILAAIRSRVEMRHPDIPFWKTFVRSVEASYRGRDRSGASEYEIYFHFAFKNFPQLVQVRKLEWKNVQIRDPSTQGHLHFVAWHDHGRIRTAQDSLPFKIKSADTAQQAKAEPTKDSSPMKTGSADTKDAKTETRIFPSIGSLVKKHGLNVRGVLHVGAHMCEEASDYMKAGIQDIVWLEANPKLVEQQRNEGHKIHHILASDIDGISADFFIASNGASSSMLPLGLHKKFHPSVSYTDSIKLTTKRIDTLVREEKLDMTRFNFLNLDIQGVELQALKGMGQLLNGFDAIYTEVNIAQVYEGCAELPELDAFLAQHGFHRKETYLTDAKWGDALYLRIGADRPLVIRPSAQKCVEEQSAVEKLTMYVGELRLSWIEESVEQIVSCVYHLTKLGYNKFLLQIAYDPAFVPDPKHYISLDRLIGAMNRWNPIRKQNWGILYVL